MDCDIDCLLFQTSKTKQSLKMTKTVIAVVKNKASKLCIYYFSVFSGAFSEESNRVRNASQPRFAGRAARGTSTSSVTVQIVFQKGGSTLLIWTDSIIQ